MTSTHVYQLRVVERGGEQMDSTGASYKFVRFTLGDVCTATWAMPIFEGARGVLARMLDVSETGPISARVQVNDVTGELVQVCS